LNKKVNKMSSKIIWLTGLSGTGKSTLSKALKKNLYDKKVKIIDGDIFRKSTKNIVKKFTKKNIFENNISIINFIKNIQNKFDVIIVSVISPLLNTRKKAKKTFKNNYYEVYLKCGIQELIRRDTKGLYKLAKEKIIKNLVGFNSKIKYEKSYYKKITLNTKNINVTNCIKIIIKKAKLNEKN